jgi:hypothetical protein
MASFLFEGEALQKTWVSDFQGGIMNKMGHYNWLTQQNREVEAP